MDKERQKKRLTEMHALSEFSEIIRKEGCMEGKRKRWRESETACSKQFTPY